jgi:hypothetical protein
MHCFLNIAIAAIGFSEGGRRRKLMKRYAELRAWQRVFACIPACACLVLVGCFPLPVRFPTRTTDASSQKVDLTFLKAGSTTREEVNQKLASIDTGVNQREFFWGRPHVSKYREILMVGYVPVGPLDRMWGVEDLLVSYDANGVVKTFVVVGDSHLLRELDSVDSAATALVDVSLVILALCTGVRCSELAALKWSDFDWQNLSVYIRRAIVSGRLDDVKNRILGSALTVRSSTSGGDFRVEAES